MSYEPFDEIAFVMMIQVGKNKPAKLVAKKGQNLKKICDKFAVKNKLSLELKAKLIQMVTDNY